METKPPGADGISKDEYVAKGSTITKTHLFPGGVIIRAHLFIWCRLTPWVRSVRPKVWPKPAMARKRKGSTVSTGWSGCGAAGGLFWPSRGQNFIRYKNKIDSQFECDAAAPS